MSFWPNGGVHQRQIQCGRPFVGVGPVCMRLLIIVYVCLLHVGYVQSIVINAAKTLKDKCVHL